MVKAMVSRSMYGKDLFELFFPEIKLIARFGHGDVSVQQPYDYKYYENITTTVEISDEIYNTVVKINEFQTKFSDELKKLNDLKSYIHLE